MSTILFSLGFDVKLLSNIQGKVGFKFQIKIYTAVPFKKTVVEWPQYYRITCITTILAEMTLTSQCKQKCTILHLFVIGFLQSGQSASCFLSFRSSTTFLIQWL